ncbi:MAG: hypothetical protein WAU70_17270 [Flavobacteriales bacterium]
MRRALIIGPAALIAHLAFGQVNLDKPLVLTGADPTDRRIDGLAPATSLNNLVTLGAAQGGSLAWALTSGGANAVLLTLQPATLAYTNGLRVRWIPTASNTAAVTLDLDGLGPVPLRDRTGLSLPVSALRSGLPAEAQYADSMFILLGSEPTGCPDGYLQANARLCIMQGEGPALNWFAAAQYCAERGAALCTWDEYLFTCQALQGQLAGLFNNWEWIDDTSDHTHSVDQIGRWTCKSMFNISATTTDLGTTRCCYQLR